MSKFAEVEGAKELERKLEKIANLRVERALRKAAAHLEGKVKEKITEGIPPPLRETTIARKGSSKPLIDTGTLRASITHKVKGDVAKVGLFGDYIDRKERTVRTKTGKIVKRSAEDRTEEQNVLIGLIHEFGAPRANIPERSFLRSTFEQEKREIKEILREELKKSLPR